MTALEFAKKQLEKFESIVVVMKDDEAKSVLSAWLSYGQACSDFVVSPNADPRVVIERLWNEAKPLDVLRLSIISNVALSRVERIYTRLRITNLIFPDGTISDGAARLIYADALAGIKFPVGRRGSNGGRYGESGSSVSQPSAGGVPEGPAAEPGAGKVRRGKTVGTRGKAARRHK